MSRPVSVGAYSLEISGDRVLVRDQSGTIVESVDLNDIHDDFSLPDGRKIDLAAVLADQGVEALQTAAGPANDNAGYIAGYIDGGPTTFHAFQRSEDDEFDSLASAGALDGTSLTYGDLDQEEQQGQPYFEPDVEQQSPVAAPWSSHDPWRIAENLASGSFGKMVDGNPSDFTFEVSDPRFEVVDGVLRLRDGISFDFESEPGIDLEITATSRTGDVKILPVHIDVTDVNEAQTGLSLDGATVSENVVGAVVGALTVADPDGKDDQSFGVSDSRFEVVDGQLKLKDGVSLDHESEPSVNVTVTATDNGGNEIQQTFTIAVGDANEAQTALSLDDNSVVENVAGAVVGALTVADPDAGDTQASAVSDSRFEIVNGQLKLKDGVSLDHENEPSVNVTITATDSAGHQIQQTFAIAVGDMNEAQTALTLGGNQVAENVASAIVGAVTVADPDAGDSQSFAVSDSRFEVAGGQLKLKDGVSLDHESEPSVNVTVAATDTGGHQISQAFSITVGDVNEPQTALTLGGNQVAENVAGAIVGAVTVADPDASDSQSFAVSDNRFEIVNGQLKLKDGVSLDHESEPGVTVTITATDDASHQIQQAFSITVGDVNEVPTDVSLSGNNVVENAAGAVIGALTVIDPDAGDAHSFQVSDNRFEVVNGQLKLKDGVSLDFESEPSLDITVTATDSGGKQVTETFTLSVGDVNEALTVLTLGGSQVAENAAGAIVGALTVVDPDAGDSQSFTVSDSRFEVVNGQLKLKDGVSLDHESEPSVNVTVTATDMGGHQIALTFPITVGDVNEAQTALTLGGNQVAENAAGAIVGGVTVADPDAGDSKSFAVSDSRFEIVNGQLKLKDGVALDHESEPNVNVTLTATDSAGHQIQQTFAITVGDVNEAQTALTLGGNQVAENAAGAIVGAISVADPDAGDIQSFAVSDSRFEVVNGQLKLKDGVALDHESEPNVNVMLTATDSAGHQIQQTFAITVGDVNEAQTALTLGGNQIAENAAGAIVGAVAVVDPDAGDSQSFAVSDSRFEVVNSQLQLKSGVSLDYEQASSVSVTVTATDAANHQYSKSFTIGVTDVNEAQTAMTLSASKVAENSAGAVIGTLSVTDPDAGDGQSFTVSDNRFEVVNGQLKLKSGASLDYEQASSVNVTVTATDQAGHQIQNGFTVNVGDVNEAPTDIQLDKNTIAENQAGGIIGSLTVIDPDQGDSHTFQVSDSRFEVASGQLRLISGASLDFETEPSVTVQVTATDSAGHSFQKNFSIAVTDVSEVAGQEIWSSQLGKGATTLGSGDDDLYIDTDKMSTVDMSDGYDTVHLAKQDLAFGHSQAVKLSNVEAIDATGYGVNNVSLSINDVLDMTDTDNHLTIIGDQGDTVTLTANGSNHWTVVDTNAQFTTYAYSDPSHQAIVEVSNQLTAQVS